MFSFKDISGKQAGIFAWSILNIFRKGPPSFFRLCPALFLCSLIFLPGCSKILRDAFREPKVRVVSLTFKESSPFSRLSTIPLLITLEVKNPNNFAIKAKYLTYTVQAGEETLAAGEKKELSEIPPENSAIIDVPLTISLDPLLRTVNKAAEKLEISITAYGSVTLESFLGDIKIPFRKQFNQNLRKLIFP